MKQKHLLIACLLGGFLKTMASDALIVVEDALYDRLTQLPAMQAAMTADGWTVEVVRYDSRVYSTNYTGSGATLKTNRTAFAVNVSSKAARDLATTIVWPRVNAGVRHVFMIGELPCAVSGMNSCPDGHGSTFSFDGWRDSQNTAGAYKATAFFGTPAPFGKFSPGWTDDSLSQLSLNIQRQNAPGDGRFDTDWIPTGYKPKAAVGWLGGFGDLAIDPNGLDRRAVFINDYLRRNVAYRTGAWNTAGAAYEFPSATTDPHGDSAWWGSALGMYGPTAVANAKVALTGAGLTNRPTAFRLLFAGSDWSSLSIAKLAKPLAPIMFLNLSYSKEVPSNSRNILANCLLNSPNFGPLVVIPFHGQSRNNITLLEQQYSVGEMFLETSQRLANTPVVVGMYGDPTLRLN